MVRLKIARRIRPLQRLLCLNATDGAAVARVQLAPIHLVAVFILHATDARRTILQVEICPAACNRVTTCYCPFTVEVDVYLCH